jgi:hypothetical protein
MYRQLAQKLEPKVRLQRKIIPKVENPLAVVAKAPEALVEMEAILIFIIIKFLVAINQLIPQNMSRKKLQNSN